MEPWVAHSSSLTSLAWSWPTLESLVSVLEEAEYPLHTYWECVHV